MMTGCAKGHEPILFQADQCPVCKLRDELGKILEELAVELEKLEQEEGG